MESRSIPLHTARVRSPGRHAGVGTWRLGTSLFLAAVAPMAISVYTVGAATEGDVKGDPKYFLIRQALYGAVGVVLMLVVAHIDYTRLRRLKYWIYGLMTGSIVFVLVLGAVARGSRRWIELPFFRFQPSELGKVLLVVVLAAFLADRARRGKPGSTTLLTL